MLEEDSGKVNLINREGRHGEERLPGSRRTMQSYMLTYAKLSREAIEHSTKQTHSNYMTPYQRSQQRPLLKRPSLQMTLNITLDRKETLNGENPSPPSPPPPHSCSASKPSESTLPFPSALYCLILPSPTFPDTKTIVLPWTKRSIPCLTCLHQ